MTASITKFPSGGGLVRNPPYRAPIASTRPPAPQRRSAHDFTLPIAGAMCGAVWTVWVAAFIGFHWWMVVPAAIGFAYGLFLQGAFRP